MTQTNPRIKFDVLDQVIEEKQEAGVMLRKFQDEYKDSEKQLEELKKQYETVLAESIKNGTDATAELDVIDDKIKAATRDIERKKKQLEIFPKLAPKGYSAEEVVDQWNNEFIPRFHKQKFDAVLDRLLQAKKEVYLAEQAYREAVSEFEDEQRAVRSELSDKYYYKLHDIKLKTRSEIEKYQMTSEDLKNLTRGNVPYHIEDLIKEGK